MLVKCAGTALNSKLIGSHKAFFAPMVVDAVLHLDDDQDISLIGIKKVPGGSMEVSDADSVMFFVSCLHSSCFLTLGLSLDRTPCWWKVWR